MEYQSWYFIHVIVSAILASVQVVQSESVLVGRRCDGNCYSLYRKPNVSWYTAYTECRKLKERLVIIPNENVQNILTQLTDGGATSTDRRVWISGSRSLKTHWTDLKGNSFDGVMGDSKTDTMCAAYNVAKNETRAVPCVVTGRLRLAACQTPTTSGSCPRTFTQIYGTCLSVRVNFTRTWLEANKVCAEDFPMGSLIYTGIDTPEFQRLAMASVAKYSEPYPEMWLGAHRSPWVWVTGENYDQELYMDYIHWDPREGASIQGECMYIDQADPNRLWRDQLCDAENSYYICENYTTSPAPATTVTPGTGASTGLSNNNIIVIVCVCVGLLVLIIIIVVVVVLVRKRKQKTVENIANTGSGQYDYPVDTYNNYTVKENNGNLKDRELSPVDIDLYRAADSVRNKQIPAKPETEDNKPRYGSVFMYDEQNTMGGPF